MRRPVCTNDEMTMLRKDVALTIPGIALLSRSIQIREMMQHSKQQFMRRNKLLCYTLFSRNLLKKSSVERAPESYREKRDWSLYRCLYNLRTIGRETLAFSSIRTLRKCTQSWDMSPILYWSIRCSGIIKTTDNQYSSNSRTTPSYKRGKCSRLTLRQISKQLHVTKKNNTRQSNRTQFRVSLRQTRCEDAGSVTTLLIVPLFSGITDTMNK